MGKGMGKKKAGLVEAITDATDILGEALSNPAFQPAAKSREVAGRPGQHNDKRSSQNIDRRLARRARRARHLSPCHARPLTRDPHPPFLPIQSRTRLAAGRSR